MDVPIVVYNVPSRTGSNIAAGTDQAAVGSAEHRGGQGGQREHGPDNGILATAPPSFSVLSGDDLMTFPMMAFGAKGVISVTSNVVPGGHGPMTHAAMDGDWDEGTQAALPDARRCSTTCSWTPTRSR